MKTMRMARPKGKKVYTVSLAFTPEQIEWLNKQPNASKLIREILDDLITLGEDVEDKLSIISLNKQLQSLQAEETRLGNERFQYLWKNENLWEHVIGGDGGSYVVWLDDHTLNPKPKDTEDAGVGVRVLQDYDRAIKAAQEKIKEIKAKILESE